MTREEAIERMKTMRWEHATNPCPDRTAFDMAISALKDIENIQFIVDTYFTRGSKSGYECMGEIDRILEPYQKGGE